VGVAAVAAVAAAGAFGGSPSTVGTGPSDATPLGTSVASRSCSRATARQLVEQYRLNGFLLPNPVAQLLCGPFTGPGSKAMAITIGAPTCWGVQRWAVLRFTQGDWQLVLDRNAFIFPLVAVGADIRETTPVFRSGDPHCIPSGGSHARIWHWNGSRLVAGPWTQVTPADSYRNGSFKTPSSNIVCDYFIHIGSRASESNLGCVIKSGLRPAPPRRPCQDGGYAGDRVFLGVTGPVRVPSCAGDPGAYVNVDTARVLGYGKTWSGGGIRCTSAVAGLTCRNKEGHGFFLSRESWRRF
jgi:hypothetical protein